MRVALLCLCLLYNSLLIAEELRLTNGEWAPYLGQQLPHQGIASRIVVEAFALEGIAVTWDFYPWARALRLAEGGQRDGTAVWLRSPAREANFFISEPVLDSGYYLFHRTDTSLDWTSVDDLQGLRIGAAIDYDYGEAFQQAERQGSLKVQRLSSERQGLKMLLAKRIDLLPIDKVVAFDLLGHGFSSAERAQLTFHPLPLRSDSMHLLLSRKVAGNAERMARFNRGLAHLRDSGKLARYLNDTQHSLGQLR
ncbi:MAG: transporter substrate-binding domain-containing protein [Pseudomonadota bacterium]